jgi:hypothetical protein
LIAAIVPALPEHIPIIATKARPADIDELWAQGRQTPAQCMETGLRLSVTAFTGLVDGVPVLMFGATPYSILAGQGVAWMVGSTDLDQLRVQKALLRKSREGLDILQRQFPLLFNHVDERNESAKRWLAWLGFSFGEPEPIGPDARLFRSFWRQGHAANR